MATGSIAPEGSINASASAARLALGIAVPIAFVGAASGLAWVGNQALTVGPLDRATFGWVVVVPLWLIAPVAAGFAWRSLGGRQTRRVALAVGSIIGAAAALVFWQWIGTPFDCGFGTVIAPINFVPQTLVVGIVIGGGLALDALLVRELARAGVRWWAVVIGLGGELVFLGLTLALVVGIFFGHTCFVAPPV